MIRDANPVWGTHGAPALTTRSIILDGPNGRETILFQDSSFVGYDHLISVDVGSGSNVGFTQNVYSFESANLDERPIIEIQNSSPSQSVYKRAYFFIYDIDNENVENEDFLGVRIYSNKVNDLSEDSTSDGRDIVFANDGDGTDDDTVNARGGDDLVFGREGNDTIRGGEGNDALIGGEDNDSLYGDNGDDYLDGGTGADILEGGYGNDFYVVDNVNDEIIESPGTGIETVESFINWNLVDGSGLDNLYLAGNAIEGIGNNLNNEIRGNDLDNDLQGLRGNDSILGGAGNDTLEGGNDDDTLEGGVGNDYLYGGHGDDSHDGGSGDDRIFGGIGNDTLTGNSGNDFLSGGVVSDGLSGSDITSGGSGADIFTLQSNSFMHYLGSGFATITDFSRAEGDIIWLGDYGDDNDNFYSLGTGNWGGTAAQDTAIYYQGDLIARVYDTAIDLNLDIDYIRYFGG